MLTQFNSASLNRHISQTYRMDLFSQGFVEILAAEQTPDNPNWFQGTADAVRQAARHFVRLRRRLLPDSRRRPSVPDGLLASWSTRTSIAAPTSRSRRSRSRSRTRRRWASSASTATARSSRSRRSRSRERLAEIGQSIPQGATFAGHAPDKPFVASMGVYVFSRDVLLDMLGAGHAPRTSAARSSRRRSASYRVQRVPVPRLLGRRRHGRLVLRREHHADARRARRSSSTIRTGRSTRTRASCPARGSATAPSRDAIIAEGCYLDRCTDRGVGRRHPHARPGRAPRSAARCCSAPTTTRPTMPRRRAATRPRLGIGRDVVLDRVIVDKNARIGDGARLVNEARRPATPTATATTSATASSSCRRTG